MRPHHYAVPEEFVDARYHRRCGIHVQTLLLAHCPITIITSLIAIGFGVILIFYPTLHHKSPIYKQIFHHYSRTKANYYFHFYRGAVFTWITVHSLHLISVAITILGTQLIRPRLLVPQLVLLVGLVGFFTLAILAVITLNAIGSRIIWVSAIIVLFFFIFTATNLYLLVLTHRYVADRREIIHRVLASTKTVKFKDTRSS